MLLSYKRKLTFIFDGIVIIFLLMLLGISYSFLQKNNQDPEVLLIKDKSGENSVTGVDVSHYQGKVRWQQVAKNHEFAFLKATQGTVYTDPRFHSNVRDIVKTSLLFSAYHFFDPDKEAKSQANHFIKTVKDYQLLMPPVLDIEVAPVKGNKEGKQFLASVILWLQYVKSATGCQPIIYTNRVFWEKYLSPALSDYSALDTSLVWISDYTKHPSSIGDVPWSFWQYTDRGIVSGISGRVDINRYRYNEQVLQQLGSCLL
ncbi:Lysozyme M1 [invertebrate metagenome]|uniref:Lysozyme M1 n=1 Tax=invertebrate metagenome TaxID=1711999 RepID=A0A2H9TB73_9ZZZZ